MWLRISHGLPGGGRTINLDCVYMIDDREVDGDHWGLYAIVAPKAAGTDNPGSILIDSFLWNRQLHDYGNRAKTVDRRIATIMSAIEDGKILLDLNKTEL